jgi:hypothetical protein
MPSDTETLDSVEDKDDTKPILSQQHEDFPSIGVELIKKINFKIAIFLFFIGLFIFSDVFIENFLPKNTIDGYCADSKGTMIQLLILVFLYLVVDLLAQGGII